MGQLRTTFAFDSPEEELQWLARQEALAGHRWVPVDDIFTADYVQKELQLANFDDMLLACGFPIDLPTLADLTAEEDARWDEMIRSRSRFSSWNEIFADAGQAWLRRKIAGEPIPPPNNPNRTRSSEQQPKAQIPTSEQLRQIEETFGAETPGRPEKEVELDHSVYVKVPWDEPPSLSLDYIPVDVVEELVTLGLAIPFHRDGWFSDTRVVVARILDGKGDVRNLVMLRRTELNLDGVESIWKSYYRVVAKPVGDNQNPRDLADAFVFDQQKIDLLLSTAWWLDAALKLVPLGTLAKHIATGEGELLETTISTLGDLAFVGRILHASGKVLAVAKGLNVTGDILEITAAGYQAKKAIDLYIEGDLSEAHSHALQATLRLLGYSPSAKRIEARPKVAKPAEQPTRKYLLDVAGPPVDPKTLTGPNRGIFTTTERSSMSQDALDYQSRLPGSVSDKKSQKMLSPGLRYDNPNPRGKNYILFDGLDLYDSKTLVDRKLGIARSKKQEEAFLRWAAGLRQNPDFKIRVEVPYERVRKIVVDFIDALPIEQIVRDRIQVVEAPK